MTYKLPDLPYAYDALEPTISANTLRFHHDKHHAAYVTALNGLLNGDDKGSLEAVIKDAGPGKVFNNAAQAWNHAFFWDGLSPTKTAPGAELAAAIEQTFGGLDGLKEKFVAEGIGHFGSGWVWLLNEGGKLSIVSTPNQDNPLMDGKKASDILLGLDVWEHAYYLKYQNRRTDYISAWWNVVNWGEVAKRYGA